MEVNGQLHIPHAYLQGKVPDINWIGGWMGPRAGLDAVEKRKSLATAWNPGRLARSPSLYRVNYVIFMYEYIIGIYVMTNIAVITHSWS
jgi:hypothetical protein